MRDETKGEKDEVWVDYFEHWAKFGWIFKSMFKDRDETRIGYLRIPRKRDIFSEFLFPRRLWFLISSIMSNLILFDDEI